MIILRKKFSARNRKYDTDLDRLGRMETSHRELSRIGDLGSEIRKMNTELRGGLSKNIKDE